MGIAQKGYIAEDDIKFWDGVNSTFTRKTSTGGTGTYNPVAISGVNVMQVYGGERTVAALNSALNSIGTTNEVELFFHPGSWTISSNVSVPKNVKVHIPPGTNLDGAGTLTFDSPDQILAGHYQIFGTSITVVFTHPGEVFSKWWQTGSYHDVSINAAIISLAAEGGTVSLPGGALEIENVITIESNGLRIQGAGGTGNNHIANSLTTLGTLIVNKSGNQNAIEIGLADTYITDIILRDFGIDGDSGSAASGHGIVLDSKNYGPAGVSQVKMYNVSISHCKNYGIYLQGNVFECHFIGCELRYNDYGIYADADYGNCTQIYFNNCEIWYSTNYGFYKDAGVTNINFSQCQFGNNDYGANSASGSTFQSCTFEDNTTQGINIAGYGTKVLGCHFLDETLAIKVVTAGASSLIVGPYFQNNTNDIDIDSGPRNVHIINPTASGLAEVDITNASRTTNIIDNNLQTMTAAGAARTHGLTELNSTAGAMAVTLANGTAIGQKKRFYFLTDGGNVTLTVATHEGASDVDFVFNDAGEYLDLEWAHTTTGWVTIKNTIT